MATFTMKAVKPCGEGPLQPFHSRHEIRYRGFNRQVITCHAAAIFSNWEREGGWLLIMT